MTTPVGSDLTISEGVRASVGSTVTAAEEVIDAQYMNAGFFDVDLALRDHLKGIKVFDRASGGSRASHSQGRPVMVYFADPEREAVDRTWPFITITLLGVERDPSREHRGRTIAGEIAYTVGGVDFGDPAVDSRRYSIVDWPIPYTFTWMVQTHARTFEHDRQIQLNMERHDKIPSRWGYLVVGDTIRHLDRVTGPVNSDTVDGASPPKRVFRKTYTVTANGEFWHADLVSNGVVEHPLVGNIALL